MGIKSLLILNYSRVLESSSPGVQPCSSLIQPFKAWSQCSTATPTAPHQLFPQIYENNLFFFKQTWSQSLILSLEVIYGRYLLYMKSIVLKYYSWHINYFVFIFHNNQFEVSLFVIWERNYLHCKKHFLNHNFLSCFPVKNIETSLTQDKVTWEAK